MLISRSTTLRIIIGILLLGFSLSCLWLPPLLFLLLIQLLSAGLAYEFIRAKFPNSSIILRVSAVIISTGIVSIIYQEIHEFILILSLVIMTIVSITLATAKQNNFFWAIFGIFYCSVLPAHLLLLKNLDQEFAFLLVLLITVVATDSSAYIVGSSIGRHKLWESVSPNKTWEGALGGLLVGSTLSIFCMQIISSLNYSILQMVILAILLSASTIVGDLFESALKRKIGIKDFSNILLEHGGLLDRVDSLIFTGMVFYWGQRLIS